MTAVALDREAVMSRDAGATHAPSRMKLVAWKAVTRNSLRGFAIVEMPNGLVIRELALHEKGGKRWVSMPAKPVLDAAGQHVFNHGGKRQWAILVGWKTRDLADEFGRRVIALVEAEHPGLGDAS